MTTIKLPKYPSLATMMMESLVRDITTIADKILLQKPRSSVIMAKKSYYSAQQQHCSGIILITATEYALGFSRQYGKGLLLKHHKESNTWSLPVAIQMRGARIGGVQNGARQTKALVLFLNDCQLETFSHGDAVIRLGSQMGIALINNGLGDVYVDISDWCNNVDKTSSSACCADSKRGNLGVSLKGNILTPMWNLNKAYYGNLWDPKSPTNVPEKILNGTNSQTDITSFNNEHIQALHESLNSGILLESKQVSNWCNEEQEKENIDQKAAAAAATMVKAN